MTWRRWLSRKQIMERLLSGGPRIQPIYSKWQPREVAPEPTAADLSRMEAELQRAEK